MKKSVNVNNLTIGMVFAINIKYIGDNIVHYKNKMFLIGLKERVFLPKLHLLLLSDFKVTKYMRMCRSY